MKLYIMKVFFIFLFPPLLDTLFPSTPFLSSDLGREAKLNSHVKQELKLRIYFYALFLFYSASLYVGDGKTKDSFLTGTGARIAHSV
jgi:hypothetical protein